MNTPNTTPTPEETREDMQHVAENADACQHRTGENLSQNESRCDRLLSRLPTGASFGAAKAVSGIMSEFERRLAEMEAAVKQPRQSDVVKFPPPKVVG